MQLVAPSASTSSNKRRCIEPTSSHTKPSHTQEEYEQVVTDLVEERAAHAQTKATLDAEVLLHTEAEVSHECAQHRNATQVELIHSLKSELNDSRTSHEDLELEMRHGNTMAFIQDQWT